MYLKKSNDNKAETTLAVEQAREILKSMRRKYQSVNDILVKLGQNLAEVIPNTLELNDLELDDMESFDSLWDASKLGEELDLDPSQTQQLEEELKRTLQKTTTTSSPLATQYPTNDLNTETTTPKHNSKLAELEKVLEEKFANSELSKKLPKSGLGEIKVKIITMDANGQEVNDLEVTRLSSLISSLLQSGGRSKKVVKEMKANYDKVYSEEILDDLVVAGEEEANEKATARNQAESKVETMQNDADLFFSVLNNFGGENTGDYEDNEKLIVY